MSILPVQFLFSSFFANSTITLLERPEPFTLPFALREACDDDDDDDDDEDIAPR